MDLLVGPEEYRVARLDAQAAVPDWAAGGWTSVTRTHAELSIVCPADRVPPGVLAAGPWRLLEVQGPLDLALTGVMASLAAPLADAEVSVFAVATFDTDYLLVPSGQLEHAVAALRDGGHTVHTRSLEGEP